MKPRAMPSLILNVSGMAISATEAVANAIPVANVNHPPGPKKTRDIRGNRGRSRGWRGAGIVDLSSLAKVSITYLQ